MLLGGGGAIATFVLEEIVDLLEPCAEEPLWDGMALKHYAQSVQRPHARNCRKWFLK